MSSYTGQFDDASEDENERAAHGERGMGRMSHRFGGFPGTPTAQRLAHHQAAAAAAAGIPGASMSLFGESPGSPAKRSRGMSGDFMSTMLNHRAAQAAAAGGFGGGGGGASAAVYAHQQAQAALSAAQQVAATGYTHGAASSAAFLQQQQQAAQYQRTMAAYGASPSELASIRYQQQQEAAAAMRERQAHAEAVQARAAEQQQAQAQAQAQAQQQSPYAVGRGGIPAGAAGRQRGSPGSPDRRAQNAPGAAGRYAAEQRGSGYYGQAAQRTTPQAPPPYMNRGGAGRGRGPGAGADSPYSYGAGAAAAAARGGGGVEAAAAAARQAAAQYKQSAGPAPGRGAGGAMRHGAVAAQDRSPLHREMVAAAAGAGPSPLGGGGRGSGGSPAGARGHYQAAQAPPPPQDYKSAAKAPQQQRLESPVTPMSVSSPVQGGPGPGRGMGRGRGGRGGRGGGGRGGRGGRGGGKKQQRATMMPPASAAAAPPTEVVNPEDPSPATSPAPASPVRSSSPSAKPPQEEESSAAADLGPPPEWYNGHVSLGLEEDKYWLSELQCYLRSSFAEAFGATESDIAAPMHGRNKPIALGQVGIRCVWCREEPYEERGQQAVSYPSLVTGIYNSVQQMYRLHFDCCTAMPPEVRRRIETLRKSSSSRGGRKQYWVDSAKRLGLADTPHGIHFSRDPSLPPPPVGASGARRLKGTPRKGTAAAAEAARAAAASQGADGAEEGASPPEGSDEGGEKPASGDNSAEEESPEDATPVYVDSSDPNAALEKEKGRRPSPDAAPKSGGRGSKKDKGGPQPMTDLDWAEAVKKQKEETYPLVLPEDKPLISDYLYLTLEQMEPCKLMDADRVGCYKGREVGFRGLACRHCVGQAGCGRYFPASEASLSQTTTSQTILNHVRNCRRCPIEIRESLELMKRAKMGPGGKNGKPKHGGRKVFFHRLWCRIQGLPIDEDADIEVKIGRQKGAKNKNKDGEIIGADEVSVKGKSSKTGKRKRMRYGMEDSDSDSENGGEERDGRGARYNSDYETESEDEDGKMSRRSRRRGDGMSDDDDSDEDDDDDDSSAGEPPSWFEGSVRLSRSDDPHWLSELHCFLRSDMIEAFSAAEEDLGTGQPRSEAVEVGQVGIRCVFCAHSASSSSSSRGPHGPGRRPKGHVYFPPSLVAIHQAATDLYRRHFVSCPEMPNDVRETMKSLKGFGAKAEGDTLQYWIDSSRELGLAESPDGIGLRFYRDPLAPSPADDIAEGRWGKSHLVRLNEDKGIVTDHAALLLMQVRPCRFKASDKRGGPGSRGRDRAVGFPGLACIHCARKNNYGRYFPVAAKSLADNAANSVMAHLSNCRRCPEATKSSLAYLTHRAQLQKAEIGGGWKRTFYKKVWDRLHHERRWTSAEGDAGDAGDGADGYEQRDDSQAGSSAQEGSDEGDGGPDDATNKSGVSAGGASGSGSGDGLDEKAIVEEMGDLIKAAAVWLSERDAAETAQAVRTRGGRGRGLPTKRIGGGVSPGGGRGRGSRTGISAKRRRVHF